MKRFIAYIELIRPGNCILSLISVFIGFFLITGLDMSLLSPNLALALASVFIITGAGNAINDYYDIESDKINRPSRPIPSGRVKKREAFLFSYGLFGLGIIMSAFINSGALMLAVFNSIVLILYSQTLQNKILIGNLSVAYLAGSTFLYGGLAAGSISLIANPLILGVLAGLTTLSREIVKDLEDIEGDKKSFLKRIVKKVESIAGRFKLTEDGIKLKLSENAAIAIAVASLLAAVVLSSLPYLWGIMGLGYLIVVVPCDVVLIWSAMDLAFRKRVSKQYSKISKQIKIGMILGFIAFIMGMLF